MADAKDLKSFRGGTQGAGNKRLTKNAASDGTRVGQTLGQIDPDLEAVVTAWATLPKAIRAGVLAMVKASGGEAR